MKSSLRYIVDDAGKKSSVLVPIAEWEEMQHRYQQLQNKLKVLTAIREGIEEVRSARKSGKKLQTLKSFLSEHRR